MNLISNQSDLKPKPNLQNCAYASYKKYFVVLQILTVNFVAPRFLWLR